MLGLLNNIKRSAIIGGGINLAKIQKKFCMKILNLEGHIIILRGGIPIDIPVANIVIKIV
tara:strand:+ start:356 stop:535 length:180 start_codon:yes stop_codon:yes gene_type:complete